MSHCPCAVTPTGSCSNAPQEHQEGEAGFAIMFPTMDGVHIKPFHFCKKSISPAALKEAGEWKEWLFLLHLSSEMQSLHTLTVVCRTFPPGLVDNPDLRVVLMFVYEAYKSGGARFLTQLLEPLAKSKALIAGGLVESVFSPSRHWWVSVSVRSQWPLHYER